MQSKHGQLNGATLVRLMKSARSLRSASPAWNSTHRPFYGLHRTSLHCKVATHPTRSVSSAGGVICIVSLTNYPHQDTGAAFLAERRFALLADEPGLGKTRQVVLGADLVAARRILVICPGAVRQHWKNEFGLWSSAGRRVVVHDGFPTDPPGDGVTVVSHAALSDSAPSAKRPGIGRSVERLRAGAPYDLIVADESAEFRDYRAKRTRALFAPDGLASLAKQVWCLSGTPVVNSAADLYPLVLGALRSPVSWEDFCTHYCDMRPDTYLGVKPVGIRNVAELADGLRPHVLRRTIESLGIPMPPLAVERTELVVPAGEVARIMSDLDGWDRGRLEAALAEQDELRDAALSRVRKALGLAKADAAAQHVARIAREGDGPVVAFFQHTAVRQAMHAALTAAGLTCSWIDGTVSAVQLRAAVAWFQAGRIDVLLVQTQAGGMGLNLVKATRAVVVEPPWTATALFQAIKRIHRISQTRACTAEVLVCPGSWLEDAMAAVIGIKRRASDDLLGRLTTAA